MTADIVSNERDHEEPTDVEEEREREDVLSVLTTSLAAVATAWAAFQSSTWSGRQTFALARTAKLRTLSTEARLEGDQQAHLDADLFVAWAGAYVGGNEPFTQFLYDRFPPRLKIATDAWIATKPRQNKDAPLHPFAMKEYQIEAHRRADTMGQGADDAVDEGRAANRISDTYVLGTVVFATIILLGSLGARLRRRKMRRVMLVFAGGALILALGWLAMMPIAWVGV